MGERTKRCFKCGQEKPLSGFYVHKQMKDGHLNKCKECTKQDVYRRVKNDPEAILKSRINTCMRNPTSKNAYRAVEAALASGALVKPNVCSSCGCPDTEHRIEAHHYDYSRPLDVIWLCTPCHEMADSRRRIRNGMPPHSVARAVLMMRDGETLCRFDSIADAARAVNRRPNTISQCLSGKSKTSAGFEWAYAEDEGEQ